MAQCRSSGVKTSAKDPEFFSDEDEVFAVDRTGDNTARQYQCPATISEMMEVFHDYQARRDTAIAALQSSDPPRNVARTTRGNDYDMFVSPITVPCPPCPSYDNLLRLSPTPPNRHIQLRPPSQDYIFPAHQNLLKLVQCVTPSPLMMRILPCPLCARHPISTETRTPENGSDDEFWGSD